MAICRDASAHQGVSSGRLNPHAGFAPSRVFRLTNPVVPPGLEFVRGTPPGIEMPGYYHPVALRRSNPFWAGKRRFGWLGVEMDA
jgi:hypothetical protein